MLHEIQLKQILLDSPIIRKTLELLNNTSKNAPADMYLAGGCIAETVFNYIYNKHYDYGIKDLDILFYSETCTKDQIAAYKTMFEQQLNSNIPCDFKNQYSMHERIKQKWNIDITPYESVMDSCTRWSLTATSIIINMKNNNMTIYAPYGIWDMTHGILRTTPKSKPPYFIGRIGFDGKTKSLQKRWPNLTIIDPDDKSNTDAIPYRYQKPMEFHTKLSS